MPVRRVALIRGINIGTAKRVAMDDLRRLVEGLGYRDVRTLLNSGNVVYSVPRASAPCAAPRIEAALARRLGVTARVTELTAAEVAAAIAANPLLDVADDPSRLLVTVLAKPADRKRVAPLAKQDWKPERLALGPRVAYVWCPRGILDSKAAAALAKALGDGATSRNWATLNKLAALLEAP